MEFKITNLDMLMIHIKELCNEIKELREQLKEVKMELKVNTDALNITNRR